MKNPNRLTFYASETTRATLDRGDWLGRSDRINTVVDRYTAMIEAALEEIDLTEAEWAFILLVADDESAPCVIDAVKAATVDAKANPDIDHAHLIRKLELAPCAVIFAIEEMVDRNLTKIPATEEL